MAVISRVLREFVTKRANGLCEYCQTSQFIVIEMEIDHIIPESAGGLTVEGNLCFACVSCNNHKSATQTAFDPESAAEVPLFNPRTQKWNDHFRWNDDSTRLIGLTPNGRAAIERLKMNRELVINARERWVKAGWHPPD
ncbi:MAG: HNH endonuclease signature motif containing protein [Chloroflexota bacterium]